MSKQAPSGTVTFLFTDIEGSTRLWEQFPQPMQEALARHDALLHQIIPQHQGHVFKTVGDAFCAAFASPTHALLAALDAQQALQAQSWPQETGSLRVRMALHTGQAQQRDNDYFGPPLNRVARLLSIGHGQQVLLSAATCPLVRDHLPEGCSVRDMSSHRLKDLQQPEHVFQVLHPSLPADFPPLRSLQAFANNLPVQVTSFIGRQAEMQEVKGLLERTRLLTLTGTGGCGKTRLAVQVGAEVVEEYSDGVWLVELASLSAGSLVVQTVGSALGLREEAGRSFVETLTEHLRGKHLLLVLDNCEHLVEVCATLSVSVLTACPKVKIIATSREPLNVPGETIYRVPSLGVPDLPPDRTDSPHGRGPVAPAPSIGAGRVEALASYDAVHLFVDRARQGRAEFGLTQMNASTVVQVCHRLDGIPLAIELAAARVRAMSVEQIAFRLNDRFRLLTGGSRTALPRHQTLRALMDWSYDLLTEQERLLLRRLSVFAGGWTLETAEQVCSGEEIQTQEVLDLLTSLVDKSLVIFEPIEDEDRYHLLETVRQYSLERLEATHEVDTLRSRHVACLLKVCEQAEPELTGPRQSTWLQRLEREHDNFRTALEWTKKTDAAMGLRIAASLGHFWTTRGHWSEGKAYLIELLRREEAAPRTLLRAKALSAAGGLARLQGNYEEAGVLHTESLAITRELADQKGVTIPLHNLAVIAQEQGDYEEARRLYEEGLEIKRRLKDRRGIAISLNNMGNMAFDQGDFAASRAFLEEALEIFRQLGDRKGVAAALYNLGNVADEQADYTAARALYIESLEMSRELEDRWGIALSLLNLGVVAQNEGAYSEAHRYYGQCYSMARELGDRGSIALALNGLGNIARFEGDYEAARQYYEEALAIRGAQGAQSNAAKCLDNIGSVAHDQGDLASADRLHKEALTIFRDLGEKGNVLISIRLLAGLAISQHGFQRAARLWGTAESLGEALGAAIPASERAGYEAKVTQALEALGAAAFAAAWEEGRQMTLERAIEYALEDAR